MANASRVIDELGDYKAFYKDVFVRVAISEVDPNFSYAVLATLQEANGKNHINGIENF